MTAVTVTCQNGHQNPEHQHYCGECGAPLPVICPEGHRNPPHQHFCGECGASLEEAHQTRQVPDDAPQQADVSEATEEQQPSAEVHHHRNRVESGSRGDDLSGPLNEGDLVQVVERDDEFSGKVGVVDEINDGDDDYNVYVLFFDRPDRYGFRRDELKVVPAAVPKAHHESNMTRPALRVGDEVQVVARDDRYDGKIGVIKQITNEDHGYNMHVDLEGGSYKTAFRQDQLKVVGGAVQQPASQKSPPVSPRSLPSRPLSQQFSGLPSGVIIASYVIVVLGIIAMFIWLMLILTHVYVEGINCGTTGKPNYEMGQIEFAACNDALTAREHMDAFTIVTAIILFIVAFTIHVSAKRKR